MFAEERLIGFLHALGLHRGHGSGRHHQVQEQEHEHAHQLFQTSTLNAIMEGAYDGNMTIGHLREHGDFGLGTLNTLDGEMIMLDGVVYQASVDGRVHVVGDEARTPFAVAQFFEPEWQKAIDTPLTYAELLNLLEGQMHSANYFYALRIDGQMSSLRARSVERQERPYRPLVEVVKEQRVFDFGTIEGTIVGFRFPDYTQGVNMPGWHLHFISADRQQGGHVLDFTLQQGQVAIQHTIDFYMELPQGPDFAEADLGKDQAEDIEKAER